MIKTKFELTFYADTYENALNELNKKLVNFLGIEDGSAIDLVDMEVLVSDSNEESSFDFKVTAYIRLKN